MKLFILKKIGNVENEHLIFAPLLTLKYIYINKNLDVWCFSSQLDRFEITCTPIRKKTVLKTVIFFKFFFAFLKPKIVK